MAGNRQARRSTSIVDTAGCPLELSRLADRRAPSVSCASSSGELSIRNDSASTCCLLTLREQAWRGVCSRRVRQSGRTFCFCCAEGLLLAWQDQLIHLGALVLVRGILPACLPEAKAKRGGYAHAHDRSTRLSAFVQFFIGLRSNVRQTEHRCEGQRSTNLDLQLRTTEGLPTPLHAHPRTALRCTRREIFVETGILQVGVITVPTVGCSVVQ